MDVRGRSQFQAWDQGLQIGKACLDLIRQLQGDEKAFFMLLGVGHG